jgi:hypothetical protein
LTLNILNKLHGNMPPMIPTIPCYGPAVRRSVRRLPQLTVVWATRAVLATAASITAVVAGPTESAPTASAPATSTPAPPVVLAAAAPPTNIADTPQASAALAALPVPVHAKDCLESGDGYLRAHLAGAIDATLDWPNKGTRCEGESRDKPSGVRLSFQRSAGGKPNLLLVFGLTGVRAGQAAHAVGTNLTIIVQGKSRIYGTLGDSRCTVDSLTQRPLTAPNAYRVEARGFCTQPAHALRGDGDVLVSTFEFAGLVNYDASDK